MDLYNKWKRKRRVTTILAMIHALIYGLEMTSVSLSSLYYLTETIHTRHANFFYALAVGSQYFSAVLSSVFLGRYMDKSRNTRAVIIGTCSLALLGNLLYSLPFSPWLLVIGRFLGGWSDATLSAMTGEFTRCYSKDEVNVVLYKYQVVFLIGIAIGPSTPLLFQGIKYRRWPVVIDRNNTIGIFLVFLNLVFLVFAYFGIANLSEEPGYTDFMAESALLTTKNKYQEMPEAAKIEHLRPLKKKSNFLTTKELLTNFDTFLILTSSSFHNLTTTFIELELNIICLNVFKMDITTISYITVMGLVSSLALTFVVTNFFLSRQHRVYFYYIFNFIIIWLAMAVMLILYSWNIPSKIIVYILATMVVLCNLFSSANAYGSSRVLLFMLIPNHSSSFCEGIRSSFCRISLCIATFIVPIVYPVLPYALMSIMAVMVIYIWCIFARYRVFLL